MKYTTKYYSKADADKFLKEHIIKGDSGDGIPNFLSDDNCLVTGIRQKPITQKKLDSWVNKNPEEFCESLTQLRNYKRNQQLIDLNMIPDDVYKQVIDSYITQHDKKASPNLMNYFISNRLKNLMENMNEFV